MAPDLASAIQNGEFVQSICDTINTNEGEFNLLPLYGKSKLFTRAAALNNMQQPAASDITDIGTSPYTIKRYIYCTVQGFIFWKLSAPWIGFIAESNEEETKRLGWRDIVVAIRGTMGTTEWMEDFSYIMDDFHFVDKPVSGARVHAGFLSVYKSSSTDPTLTFGATSMRDQICGELRKMLGDGDTLPVRITITGHSLGAALATLVACDVGCNVVAGFANVTVSLITFASPKVGNNAFKTNAEEYIASIWRYRNLKDPVPLLPPWSIFNPYVHVGTDDDELILDWTRSPYVSLSKLSPHELELYLHAIAAENGAAVYNSSQLKELLAAFPLPPGRGSTYVIEEISQMSAWDDQDPDLVRRDLEHAKNLLIDDPPAMEAYFREIYYIALSRSCKEGSIPVPNFDKRDHALLNKNADILKPEYCVPATWLIHPNKDMVRDPGSLKWLPRVYRLDDIPTPDNPDYN